MRRAMILIIIIILLLVSCRPRIQIESGVDLSQVPEGSPINVPIASPSVTPEPTITASPTEIAIPDSLSSLRIVYSDDDRLWLWESGTNRTLAEGIEAMNLFDPEQIEFSSDGQWVAFTRGDEEVRVINVDGTDERLILGSEYFGGMGEDEYGDWSTYIQPYMTTWISGTHRLMINTLAWIDTGLYSPHGDAFLVDLKSGERSEISGGYHYFPSPDGKILAVTGRESVSVLALENMVMREALVFEAYRVYNPMDFRPNAIWKEDSSSFIVVLLPPEREHTFQIWQIDPKTLETNLIVELPWCYRLLEEDGISPDFSYLVYVCENDENSDLSGIIIRDIDLSSERQLLIGDVREVVWSPASDRFVMLEKLHDGNSDNVILGDVRVDGEVERLPLGEVTDVAWIDSNTLLLFSRYEIRLWMLDEMEAIHIADLAGWFPNFDDYDFYLEAD
jgi:hypothetical protein